MSTTPGHRCGFCGRPNFEVQELLEQHVDNCAPIHGFQTRFGTGVSSIGRKFKCDPVSGLASLRPEHVHICPWCMTSLRTAQEASQHRTSCTARRRSQEQYQPTQPNVTAQRPSSPAQPLNPGGDIRQLPPQQTYQQSYTSQTSRHFIPYNPLPQTQLLRTLQPQTQPRNLQPQPQRHNVPAPVHPPGPLTRSPYFNSNSDEKTLIDRINEPPSHLVMSLLVDIARSNADARAIPDAPVGTRSLPVVRLGPGPMPAQLSRLQPKTITTSSASQSRPMVLSESAKSSEVKAKKQTRKRFTMCEGCDRYCKHPGKKTSGIVTMNTNLSPRS